MIIMIDSNINNKSFYFDYKYFYPNFQGEVIFGRIIKKERATLYR